MLVTEVHAPNGELQIGGGAGYFADRVREARDHAREALLAINGEPTDVPVIGPYPRVAALAAAREAVVHLTEALVVEAPEDAITDTRHALEELQGTIVMLERIGLGLPVRPGNPPAGRFERAIELLVAVEHRLARPVQFG